MWKTVATLPGFKHVGAVGLSQEDRLSLQLLCTEAAAVGTHSLMASPLLGNTADAVSVRYCTALRFPVSMGHGTIFLSSADRHCLVFFPVFFDILCYCKPGCGFWEG